jgi:hypothetical protein
VEPFVSSVCAEDYGQPTYYEQPMFQVAVEEVITHGYGTWVPTLHEDNPFYGDTMKQAPRDQLEGPFASLVGHENGVVIFSCYFLHQRLWNY